MTEKQITDVSTDIDKVRQLYETAFPVEEQIPWYDLMELVERMPLDFTVYYDADQLMGFTIVYPRPSFNWFWYFAVPPSLRGHGTGQLILSRFIKKYETCTNILDMESPEQKSDNQAIRQRRHSFYLRNGFRDTGVGRSFGGVDYTIMMMGKGTFTMQDYDKIVAELHSFWTNMPNKEEAPQK